MQGSLVSIPPKMRPLTRCDRAPPGGPSSYEGHGGTGMLSWGSLSHPRQFLTLQAVCLHAFLQPTESSPPAPHTG